jgi:thiosulfate dehydrogenase
MIRSWFGLLCATALLAAAACSQPARPNPAKLRYKLSGPLIPAKMTMVTAWDVPNNPLEPAAALDQSKLSKDIQWGYRLFMNTPAEAKPLAPGQVSCTNCHLNAGQRERALPLVGVAGAFPEYNKRAGRLITLADRVVDCFLRSENVTGERPTTSSKEVLALSAYLTWLANGYHVGVSPAWRGQNTIAAAALIPIDKLDPSRGEALFKERCTTCHGPDGQGVFVGDKKPAPLWGPNSWNDGAGAARVYTLAGMIRYTMPYLNPGSLSDEEAQQLAAFITTKPRPSFAFKADDYRSEPLPVDAVYYPKR